MQSLHDYQGFAVNFTEISILLNSFSADKQSLLKQTGFGDNKVRSLLDYLRDFGLVTEDKKDLSKAGYIIRKADINLYEDFTKWICLYSWSKKERNPALHFTLNFARTGQSISSLTSSFKEWAAENAIQTDYKKDFANKLLNLSRKSLLDQEVFQRLELITLRQDKVFRSQPYNVHPLLIAYILFDNSRGRKSVSITQLMNEPGNIGRFFNYTEQVLNKRLSDLENLHLVERVQNANLNMVQLNYEGDIIDFIDRFYAEN